MSILCFDAATEQGRAWLRWSEERQARREGGRKALLCAACGHPVTAAKEGLDVAGGHTHRFTNPHGFKFHIGCFARAPGCAEVGAASVEHTWFPGYAWRFALCRGCGVHLGWGFHPVGGTVEAGFFGLILTRLRQGG